MQLSIVELELGYQVLNLKVLHFLKIKQYINLLEFKDMLKKIMREILNRKNKRKDKIDRIDKEKEEKKLQD